MAAQLPPLWSALLELQQLTDSSRITARSHATDEAFAAVLDELDPGNHPPSPEVVRRRFDSLVSNRAKKFRARMAIETQLAHHERMHRNGADAHTSTLYRLLTMTVLSTVKTTEATALAEVFGEGLEYHELAAHCRPSSGIGRPASHARPESKIGRR